MWSKSWLLYQVECYVVGTHSEPLLYLWGTVQCPRHWRQWSISWYCIMHSVTTFSTYSTNLCWVWEWLQLLQLWWYAISLIWKTSKLIEHCGISFSMINITYPVTIDSLLLILGTSWFFGCNVFLSLSHSSSTFLSLSFCTTGHFPSGYGFHCCYCSSFHLLLLHMIIIFITSGI